MTIRISSSALMASTRQLCRVRNSDISRCDLGGERLQMGCAAETNCSDDAQKRHVQRRAGTLARKGSLGHEVARERTRRNADSETSWQASCHRARNSSLMKNCPAGAKQCEAADETTLRDCGDLGAFSVRLPATFGSARCE